MQSLITKAKDLGLKGREKLGHYGNCKQSDHIVPERTPSAGSPSFSRKKREAALKADLFAGPDKIVSAANTYGLIKLTIHEAKVQTEQRYCAVVSIGMQVGWLAASSLDSSLASVTQGVSMQTYMSRTEKASPNPKFEEGLPNLLTQITKESFYHF